MNNSTIPAYVTRARTQINIGEYLAITTGADRNDAVEAAHFLIPDGAAARQGDNPGGVQRHSCLRHLHGPMARAERAAVRSWSASEWRRVLGYLLGLGPSRAVDVARLATHRMARR